MVAWVWASYSYVHVVTGFVATGVATNLDRLDHAMDWTVDWTQDLWKFCGLLNSLQVARERKEPGACGLKIAHDCTYAMICMHATLRGGLVTMAVSGPVMYLVPWACQGLIYWGSYARVEA